MCATQPTQSLTQRPNSNSHGKTRPSTQDTSQRPKRSREDKRKAWAKKAKPVAKTLPPVGPVREYLSVCCNSTARKPKAGQKEVAKDPESGKMKSASKGLGHWRCSACAKACKVTVHQPAEKVEVPIAKS